jgi:hypothetical protein
MTKSGGHSYRTCVNFILKIARRTEADGRQAIRVAILNFEGEIDGS